MVAVRTSMVIACSSIDWLLQLPGAVLLIGKAPFVYWGVSNYCALTEVFLLPRIQLCSLHRLSWLLLPYDYRHDYFLVSSMLKLSSLKPSKYTRWIFASIGRFVTLSLPPHMLIAFWKQKPSLCSSLSHSHLRQQVVHRRNCNPLERPAAGSARCWEPLLVQRLLKTPFFNSAFPQNCRSVCS